MEIRNQPDIFSKKQEDTIAKQLGGRRVANSGATMFQKGDIITDNFLLEAKTKTTSSKSISIKKDWLIKNKREALSMSKPYNALVFNFGPDDDNYYIIDVLFQVYIFLLTLIKHQIRLNCDSKDLPRNFHDKL